LAKLGKENEALYYASDIKDVFEKSRALLDISIELAKQRNYTLAEKTAFEIPKIITRQNCWKSIAKNLKEQLGLEKSLELRKEFKREEAIVYYLKGWAESISLEDISDELIQKAIPVLKDDNESLVKMLQLYAIHQLFLENPAAENINRYNRTLNLQWAIDIKNQLMQ
jgi:hypothetical protein